MITVGICTRGRASLTRTLTSLARQSLKADAVFVADADDRPSAAGLCAWGRDSFGLPITYRHVPGRNLALARNACLEAAGGRLAFIADDQAAPPIWLAALDRALVPGLGAVFGPIRAVYPPEAPPLVAALDAHGRRAPRRGTTLRTAEADNALLDLASPALDGLRFDPALGREDGGDRDFFRRARAKGTRYAFATEAFVETRVPADAAQLDWLLAREKQRGAADYASLPEGRRRAALRAAAEGFALAGAARFVPGDVAKARAALRAARHEGVLMAARSRTRS